VKDCKIYMEGTQKYWILNKLKVTSILAKIASYKTELIQHVNQMPRCRLPNLLAKYAPRGIKQQTTEEAPEWTRLQQASNDLFPWKWDDDEFSPQKFKLMEK
jgi:hypothetical protein